MLLSFNEKPFNIIMNICNNTNFNQLKENNNKIHKSVQSESTLHDRYNTNR